MSHSPERKEKNCLNCHTTVHGRYCHVCGQENIETRESFWSLTRHFIFDILHFDGKFFHTLTYIFTRPGFVARQYAEGKRASYLHPIRMYLFTSAVFFLIFFSVQHINLDGSDFDTTTATNEERVKAAKALRKIVRKQPGDSGLQQNIALLLDTAKPMSIDSFEKFDTARAGNTFGNRQYASLKSYDQEQNTLPDSKKDNWFKRKFIRQIIGINERHGKNTEGTTNFLQFFLHKLPYMLFLSLPFFALLLKLLYIRRKNFYYSDHAVFTFYHYILSFILLLLCVGVDKLHDISHWGFFNFLLIPLVLAWPAYLYLQMKNFYRQGRGKTVAKFILLNLSGFFLMLILLLLFALLSVFQL